MTLNAKKVIIFSILAILAIGAAYAFYMYTKGPVNIKNETSVKVDAITLYQAFLKDSLQSRNKYTNRIVESTGEVAKISQNQQNQVIVLLKTNETGAYINCTMEGPADKIAEKENITLKGLCTGIGMGDEELGILGDVYLIRCYLAK